MSSLISADSVTALIDDLPNLPSVRLRELWQEAFGRPAGRIRPEVMLPILAFRLQEKVYGGLTGASKDRSEEILKRLTPKKGNQIEARQRFKSGTRLVREWKGKTHEVILTTDGYDYQGKTYKSLSSIACRITGTHWSGPAFFGTRKKELSK
jgi:hypothetical protein